MLEKRTGGCHCGVVRYEVELDLATPTLDCNCSYCQIKGLLLQFVPATQFTLISGEDHLTEYRFHKKRIVHLFCNTCGVQSFSRSTTPDGTPKCAINVRTLDNIDLSILELKPFDGKNL